MNYLNLRLEANEGKQKGVGIGEDFGLTLRDDLTAGPLL